MIDTKRLFIRKLEERDIEDFCEIFSSDRVDKFVRKMTRQEAERYIEKAKNAKNKLNLSVVLKEENKVIGNMQLKLFAEREACEISYVFNDKYWGRGYATEACRAALEYAFTTLKIQSVEADARSDNFASIKILKDKMNMRFISERFEDDHTGQTVSYSKFEISKEEYFR